MISDVFWRRRFSGNPSALGARLSAGDLRLIIIGVMPPGFEHWRGEAHLWIPIEAGVPRAQLTQRAP